MTIIELKEIIKDIPDDAKVVAQFHKDLADNSPFYVSILTHRKFSDGLILGIA